MRRSATANDLSALSSLSCIEVQSNKLTMILSTNQLLPVYLDLQLPLLTLLLTVSLLASFDVLPAQEYTLDNL